MALQFDGGAFAPSDVPHDDGVVRAAGEQHPLNWVPTQRHNVTWGGTPRQMCGETHADTKVNHECVHVAVAGTQNIITSVGVH